MTRTLKLILLMVCAPLYMTPWRSALGQGQDQFYNTTPGNRSDSRPDERDGWEFTGDPYNNTGQYKACHANPRFQFPEGPDNHPLICLEPGKKPPYLQGKVERGPAREAPDQPATPFDPYASGAPLQPVSPQKPLSGNAGQSSSQPEGSGQGKINAKTASYVLLAGATEENCQLTGSRKIGKNGGYEELFICIGPDRYDEQPLSGSITSVDGGTRVYKTIGGTFRAGPDGRQPTFYIEFLNGEIPPGGRIMTVKLESEDEDFQWNIGGQIRKDNFDDRDFEKPNRAMRGGHGHVLRLDGFRNRQCRTCSRRRSATCCRGIGTRPEMAARRYSDSGRGPAKHRLCPGVRVQVAVHRKQVFRDIRKWTDDLTSPAPGLRKRRRRDPDPIPGPAGRTPSGKATGDVV
jgi:hypothetical protein